MERLKRTVDPRLFLFHLHFLLPFIPAIKVRKTMVDRESSS